MNCKKDIHVNSSIFTSLMFKENILCLKYMYLKKKTLSIFIHFMSIINTIIYLYDLNLNYISLKLIALLKYI